MSKTRRDIQQQLQKDEVAETLQQIADNFRKNRTLLITMAIVLVVGLVTVMMVRSHRAAVQTDTNDKVSAAITAYTNLISQSDPVQRKPDLEAALATADTLATSYPNSAVGREGMFLKGRAWFFFGNSATTATEALSSLQNAQKAYQAFLDQAQTDEEKARAEIALGYAFENEAFFTPKAKQFDKINSAMTHYTRAAALATGANPAQPEVPYLYYYARLGEARLYELQPGQEAKAIEIYNQILKNRPVPVPTPAPDQKREAGEDNLIAMLRQQIEQGESQMSFEATARLRLNRLQGSQTGAQAVTAEVKATPAVTATPTAKATATPAAKTNAAGTTR